MKRLLAAAWVLLAAAPAASRAAEPPPPPAVEYKATIKGLDRRTRRQIRDSCPTFVQAKRPPATLGQLRWRAEGDVPRIVAILESRGYHDAEVGYDLDASRPRVRVVFRAEPGGRYRFGRIGIRFAGLRDPEIEAIKPRLRAGQPAVAEAVFEEQRRILALLRRKGYPFPSLAGRTVAIDRENRAVDVELEFDPGMAAVYGEVEVSGLDRLPAQYIRRQVPWRQGSTFDAQRLDDFEKKLLGSGLFSSVRVRPVAAPGGSNAIPVEVAARERDLRTVRLGASYSDIGPGAKAYWEHRSLFGGGERFQSALSWSSIETALDATLLRPGVFGANQALRVEGQAAVERPDAYDARRARITGMVLRDFTPRIQGGAGLGYKYSLVDQLGESERFGHLVFPFQAQYDSRNDTLNPVRGGQVFGRTAFYEDTLGAQSFFKSGIEARHYLTWSERYRLSIALRLALGGIDGAALGSVPADERLYAGGGGSIRGYEYQAVGPAIDSRPVGGSRSLEFSAELRLQPGSRLGYAVFIDGGTACEGWGDVGQTMRYGAGAGVRWFTAIGPLRADAAYPLNPDATQVKRIQFYISLGQSF